MSQARLHLLALLLGVTACGGVLAWLAATVPTSEDLAADVAEALAGVDPTEIPARMDQLASLGDAALPPLVRALNDDREVVAASALQILDQHLEQWRQIPLEESTPHVLQLAALLEQHVVVFQPAARRSASHLAEQLLDWPPGPADQHSRLLTHCDAILTIAGQVAPASLARGPALVDGPRRVGGYTRRPMPAPTSRPPEWVRRPTGDAPSGSSASSDVATRSAAPVTLSIGDTPAVEARSAPPVANRIGDQGAAPEPVADGAPRTNGSLVESPPTNPIDDTAPAPPKPLRPTPSLVTLENTPVSAPAMHELTTREVMRWLLVDGPQAAAAVEELRARGFEPIHIQVARKFVDPNPRVRVALVEALPDIANLDARPWLLWLSRDPDRRVRKVTVGVMATSRDPTLQTRLRELEREEDDPEVLRTVRQALQRDS